MTRHAKRQDFDPSRRRFIIGAAGLTFAFVLEETPLRAVAAVVGTKGAGKELSPWVSISPDGTITIMSAATEMGQGSMTLLPRILAEELGADWDRVRIAPAPVIEKIYGNPMFGGDMKTAASSAVTGYFSKSLARKCAAFSSTTPQGNGTYRHRSSRRSPAWSFMRSRRKRPGREPLCRS